MVDIDLHTLDRLDLTYEEMRELAANPDEAIRAALAKRQDLRPEILYFLAEDDSATVRELIAQNPSTPRKADLLLASDEDDTVRSELGRKIAKCEAYKDPDKNKIQHLTYEALSVLSRDQVVNVRRILSEALKDVANAPADVILHLAKDMDEAVSKPVLQYSPVLRDEDLLDMIAHRQGDYVLDAISLRAEVSENVSDAVIDADVEGAIAQLLANPNAHIRESTIDQLVERAQDVPVWHEPLAKRPALSVNAVKRMSLYLVEDLLTVLYERQDLPGDALEAVREEVKKRIDVNTPLEEEAVVLEKIETLHKKGELEEQKLMDWLYAGQELRIQAALSVLSGFTRVKVKKIIASQSGKGVMALVWKAGLSANFAEEVQIKLAKVPLKDLYKATEKGDYPLSEDDMSWHLELFGD